MAPQQPADALGALFERCKDSENAFRLASRHTRNQSMRNLFLAYAQQRADYAARLQAELERVGAHNDKTGTVGEAFRQGWDRIKNAITGSGEQAVLAECQRNESAAVKLFEEVLRQDLPAEVRSLVEQQYAGVQEANARIQALVVVVA